MRFLRPALMILALVLPWLSACTQAQDCSNPEVFCAALVTNTSGLMDHGINTDAWLGLQQARSNGSVDRIEIIESVDTRDYEKNITYFAGQGFDVIVTSGIGLEDETLRAAEQYPASVFIGMEQPQEEHRDNLISVTFPEDQMGFAAGVLAARITATGIIGGVCETSEIDSMWRYCEGFRAGAKFADKDVKVQIIYRENGDSEKLFLDEEWGFTTAQTLIGRGADVIFSAGGLTGQGALRAASESGTQAIGTERDQRSALGNSGRSVIASFLGRADSEVQNLLRVLHNWEAYQPQRGKIGYILMPLETGFPETMTVELDAVIRSLESGEIETGVAPERP